MKKQLNPILPWLVVGLVSQLLWSASAQVAYVNFEGKQTNPLRLSPDGTRLFAVNTPDARLSVFDVSTPSNPILIAEIPVGIEPVSVNPFSNDKAWVVNEVSDSVSIVSVTRGIVTDTLQAKDEPADVVFAGGRAFVSCSRNNTIRVFDAATHAELAIIPVLGNNPRALAVSPDGAKVYAAFALSGNRTTLIPKTVAPPQPPPVNITNPPPQVGLIVDATDPNWSTVIQYTMPDNDVVEIDPATLAVTRYFSRAGTVNMGLAVHPVSGDLFVANTDARNLIRFEPNVRGHVVDNRVSRIAVADGTVTPFDLNPGIDFNTLPNPSALSTALAQPTAMIFNAAGSSLYVAAFGTDRIARLDTNGMVLSRIELGSSNGAAANPRTKRGPRGLAFSTGGTHLYVLNRIANTMAVINTATEAVVIERPVGSYDPTPAFIREGRGFLYDAKLSGNGTVSCASCHVDAEMDMLAWDLGDPNGQMEPVTVTTFGGSSYSSTRHPMKGPMTTQTLRGLKGLEPLHWRGDRANFLAFNGAFNSLMGGTLLTTTDIAAYRSFVERIVFQPNPNQKLDRTLPAELAGASPIAGLASFQNQPLDLSHVRCNTCHRQTAGSPLPVGPGTNRVVFDTARLSDSQHIKTAHLRNLYQKTGFTNEPGAASIAGFGFSHDGRDAGLFKHFVAPRFGTLTQDNPTANLVKSNLVAFLLCFDTGTPPAVGYSRTITALNVESAASSSDWTLLERQASVPFQDAVYFTGSVINIRLIAKGTVDGERRSLLYQPATSNYATDKSGVGPFTRAELEAKVLAGDTLTFMGVPTASGPRMALDRDLNGVIDSDESPPLLTTVRAGAGMVVSWKPNAVGVVLEVSEDLSANSWRIETIVQSAVGDRVEVSIPTEARRRFYRLRNL